jgi:NitT/TauT family transport system permease protein
MSAITTGRAAADASTQPIAGGLTGFVRRSALAIRRRTVGTVKAALPPLVTLGLFLVGWLAVSYGLLTPEKRFLLPPPQDVVSVGILDPDSFNEIWTGLVNTAQVAFTGLFISIVVGFAIAIVMAQSRLFERALYPWAVVLQTVPILALVPIIGFWYGFDFGSRVIVCVLISLFPIITNTLFGLRSADRGHHDLFTLHGASRLQRLLKLQLPGALPAIFTGLRISGGLSVVGAIVGDFFFRQGDPGLGRLLDMYTARLESERLFAAVIFSSLLGLSVFWFFGIVGRLAVRSWHESAQERP